MLILKIDFDYIKATKYNNIYRTWIGNEYGLEYDN